jgi:transposase
MYGYIMRKYSKEYKEQILKETKETGSILLVSKKHSVPKSTIQTWLSSFKNIDSKIKAKENRNLEKKVSELELENQILKELLKKTNQIWLRS